MRGVGSAVVALLSAVSLVSAENTLRRIRGVNIGGWLVLERWIKPSLFRDGFENNGFAFSKYNDNGVPADQWNFCSILGKDECRRRLEEHWDTWLTAEDVSTLASAGITHMRVPMGYWLLGDIQDDEPFVDGDLKYLLRLLNWARDNEMQVWVDLHAAPGSQNGFDNSGKYGSAEWALHPENVERSVRFLNDFAQLISAEQYDDVVTGIGLLNEPDPSTELMTLTNFYERGFQAVRSHLPSAAIFVGDMFTPADFNWFWANGAPDTHQVADKNNPMTEETNGRVFLDTHIYHVFTSSLRSLDPSGQVERVCTGERDWIDQCCWQDQKPTQLGRIVGEWTAAYDQKPSEDLENAALRPMTEARKNFLDSFVKAQMTVFEQPEEVNPQSGQVLTQDVSGWFFWNFKMETDIYREWDYLKGLQEGWIPRLPQQSKDNRMASEIFGSCDSIADEVYQHRHELLGVVKPFPPEAVDGDDNRIHADGQQGDYLARTMSTIIALAIVGCLCIIGVVYRMYYYHRMGDSRWSYERIKEPLRGARQAAHGAGEELKMSV